MFAEVQLEGQLYKALVDMGASNIFITGDCCCQVGACCGVSQCINEGSQLRTITCHWRGMAGEIKIGEWVGLADILVIEMDDYDMVLGLEFLEEQLNAVIIPRSDTLLI